MSTFTDIEKALLAAAQALPLTWLLNKPDEEGIRLFLMHAAAELEGVKKEPEIAAIQSEMIALAYTYDLALIFFKGRAIQAAAKLNELTTKVFSKLSIPEGEEITIPVSIFKREYGSTSHIYKVLPAPLGEADYLLDLKPGDLFEVLEPRKHPQRLGSHRPVSRHMTLSGANAASGDNPEVPRLVRIVSPRTEPITAQTHDGVEVVVAKSTEYAEIYWTERLRPLRPGALVIAA